MLLVNVANQIYDSQVQSAGQAVVELSTTKAQNVKEKGQEECEEIHRETLRGTRESSFCKGSELEVSTASHCRRYWGSVELHEGDRLVWRNWNGKESFCQ
ncbi:TMV resistance protein N, partial [Trifolium medium]|nr:TMV resistance protein N [Trifolium medium]